MTKNITITFKSMSIRGDGDSGSAGELYYDIFVDVLAVNTPPKRVFSLSRSESGVISKNDGETISQAELSPNSSLAATTTTLSVNVGDSFRVSAIVRESDSVGISFFKIESHDETPVHSEEFRVTDTGTIPLQGTQTFNMNGQGISVDLNYDVTVQPELLVPFIDPLQQAGITQAPPVEGLKGVEMFTNRQFKLPPFGSFTGGFSQVFPIGEFPTLPPSSKGVKKSLGVTDNSINSIRVGSGLRVTLFMEPNFQQTAGEVITLTGNVNDLGPTWGGKISSFIVSEIPGPPH